MIYNVLWTVLLGIIGGVISSLIVSKVFLIQSEYQKQVSFVGQIVRKMSLISAFLQLAKTLFQVSFDRDLKIKHEMQEEGHKTEEEYYCAHKDMKWQKDSDALDVIRKEVSKTAEAITTDVANTPIDDPKLIELLRDIMVYVHEVSSAKELSFSSIGDFVKKESDLLERYDGCKHMTGRALYKLIMKDKMMITLVILILALIAGVVVTSLLNV